MDDLRASIAQLTPDQRTQLEARLRGAGSSTSTQQGGISPREDQTTWPMSAAQIRIWTLSRLRPNDPLYNIQGAWRIQGPLDRSVLQASFGEIIRRHEALRARFTEEGGAPFQDVRPFEGFELPSESVVNLDAGDALEHVRGLAKAEAERPFDLASDPLIRVRLLEVGPADQVLVVTAHHLVCDGWSMDIIEQELTVLYADLLRGERPSLAPLPFQFADFAAWQQEWLLSPSGQADVEYWRARLEPPVAPLQVRRRSTGHGNGVPEGGHVSVSLDEALSSSVNELSRINKVTPFVTLLTGFQLALHQMSGQEDIVLVSPAAGRTRLETEPLIGYFNNLVVLRGDLSGDPSVQQLLQRNRSVVMEAFDHQAAAFQDVAALPSVASVPLARGLFVLQQPSQEPLQVSGASVTPFSVEAEAADFELGVFMREINGEYRAVIRYHRSVFAPDEVKALMSRFDNVLRAMIEWPDRPRSEVIRVELTASPKLGEDDTTKDSDATLAESRPRTLLESQLKEIWERVFRVSPISVNDDFFELGGHSLLAAELIAEIERHMVGEALPLATLFRAPTIAELAEVIANRGWSDAWASLVPIQPKGSRPPLFFVHAHGGNVVGYRDLAKRLGDDQPFYGLQAAGMDLNPTEVAPRRLESIATQYVEELRTVQKEGPYLLGGYCLGGDVAFEMAHQLKEAGEDVAMLVMVDNPRPEFIAQGLAASRSRRTWNRLRTRLHMEWSNFAEVPWRGKWRFMVERVSRLAVLAPVKIEGLVPEWLRIPRSRAYRRELIVAAHEKAYERYHPPPYSGPITLVRAEQQPYGRPADADLGWSRYVDGIVDVIEAPGHGVGLLSEPRVSVVAEQIRAALESGLAEEGSSES